MSKRTRTLVFTDLDGTLLDHASYSWKAAIPALKELEQRKIPLVLCTSKTIAEVNGLRRAMGNPHPFIVENGGAIVIPAGYFRPVAPFRSNSRALTLVLGRPYDEVVRELNNIAQATGVRTRGFHQMSDADVARETGLPVPEARQARQRKTGEPFLFCDGSSAAIRSFRGHARERGYSVQRGGRFWHFSAGCDKGLALSVLLGLYALTWRTNIRTIALGDSGNDLSMLRLVDRPILVPKPDGSFSREILRAIPKVTRAPRPGPLGWNEAVLEELCGKSRRRPPAMRNSPESSSASHPLDAGLIPFRCLQTRPNRVR